MHFMFSILRIYFTGRVKTFEEARGNVINDYETEIEAKWIEGLTKSFSVDVNKEVLRCG